MNQNLAELFEETINEKLQLDRQGRDWSLNEELPITIKAPSRHSLGFSLDRDSSPLSKLFEASPPLGIAKMCDAIIVLSHKNKDYIFLIEQKTRHKNDYKKQLDNGKYFCDWLLVLLKKHGHYDGEVVFISLLCWQPREKSPRKGTTHHGNGIISENRVSSHMVFEVKNKNSIYLLNFIKK